MPDSLLNIAFSLPNFGSVLLTLFGIGLVIFVHEAGHFMCARLCGVDVEVFSLGFGPRLFGWTRGGTDYRISAVPIGGYVKMFGDQPGEGEGDPGALNSKSVGQRFLVYSGGVIMNIIFALVVFPIIFTAGVRLEKPAVGRVTAGGPAWQAGLREGDEIVEVNGREVLGFSDVSLEVALSDPERSNILIRRNGVESLIDIRPEYSETVGTNVIGIGPPFAYELVVDPDGVAAKAGLHDGDLLLEVEGEPASEIALRYLDPQQGNPVQLLVQTGTEPPRQVELAPSWSDVEGRYIIGIRSVQNQVAALRGALAASGAMIKTGDKLLEAGGRPVYSNEHLRAANESFTAGTPLPIRLLRDGQPVVTEIPPSLRVSLVDDIALTMSAAFYDPGDGEFKPVEVQVTEGSAAAAAGLIDGSVIVEIGGIPVSNWSMIQSAVEAVGSGPLPVLAMAPDGTRQDLTITPQIMRNADYGFDLEGAMVNRVYGFGRAFRVGMFASWNLARQVYLTLRKMVSRQVSATNLGGPVAITTVSYRFAQDGLARFFYFLALLSINLAVVNVLPIPVLDGGHLLFLLVEKVKGSPVDDNVMGYSQVFGLVLILSLLIFVTYHDIVRLVG